MKYSQFFSFNVNVYCKNCHAIKLKPIFLDTIFPQIIYPNIKSK